MCQNREAQKIFFEQFALLIEPSAKGEKKSVSGGKFYVRLRLSSKSPTRFILEKKEFLLVSKKFISSQLQNILTIIWVCLVFDAAVQAQQDCSSLFEDYKKERKKTCGQRDEAIRLGKLIIEKFGNDLDNKEVIDFVKKDVANIEKEEKKCRPRPNLYESKNWPEFFALSKEIIAEEGDTPLALDVMLTLVAVGFDRVVIDKNDAFNSETVYYAKLAVQKIEAGQTSETKKWGVFQSFKTKEKALWWMNYIAGYISYHKFNQRKEALVYLYKAIQSDTAVNGEWSIYQLIGNYCYEQLIKFQRQDTSNGSEENPALAKAYAELAMDAYGRAYKLAVKIGAKKEITAGLYNRLVVLYRFRFAYPPKMEMLDLYIEKLISRPMPDPTVEIEPLVRDE